MSPSRHGEATSADLRAAGERIEALLDASAAGGAVARERAEELVRLVVDLYGAGLERLLEIVHETGRLDDERARPRSPTTTWSPACCWCTACTRYDVEHPGRAGAGRASGPTSARTAATSSCSGSATTGVVRLRLLGSCDGCPSSSVTLKLAVEDGVEAAAPEVDRHRGRGRPRRPTPRPVGDPGRRAARRGSTTPAADAARRGTPVAGARPSWPPGEVARLRGRRHRRCVGVPGRRATCTPTATAARAAAAAWPRRRSSAGSAGAPATPCCAAPAAVAHYDVRARRGRARRRPATTSTRCRCWCATASRRSPCRRRCSA